ncbi:hypothetical protein ACIRVM_45845, partial [Streptomyces chartreusis]
QKINYLLVNSPSSTSSMAQHCPFVSMLSGYLQLFPTAERKARLCTDMARAWWSRQRPEQTAHALLDAYRASPGEVRDRPAIRAIVDELAERHPRITGVRELRTALATS